MINVMKSFAPLLGNTHLLVVCSNQNFGSVSDILNSNRNVFVKPSLTVNQGIYKNRLLVRFSHSQCKYTQICLIAY